MNIPLHTYQPQASWKLQMWNLLLRNYDMVKHGCFFLVFFFFSFSFFGRLLNKWVCTVCRSCISIACTKHYLNLHDRKVWNLAGNVQFKIKSLLMEPSFVIFTKLSATCISQHLIYLIYVSLIKELCLKSIVLLRKKKRNVIIYILQHISAGRQDLCCLWFQSAIFLALWELPPWGSGVTYISLGSDKRLFSNRVTAGSLPLQVWPCWLSLRYLGKFFWCGFCQLAFHIFGFLFCLAAHVSHLENVSEEEMNRLLGIVLDVEYLFTCVHKEEDADTKQVYFYLFKVSWTCAGSCQFFHFHM